MNHPAARDGGTPAAPGRGFTLLELLTTVSIIAITLALGVPAYSQVVAANRLATGANGLIAALAYARSEAVKQGAVVLVCKSADWKSWTVATKNLTLREGGQQGGLLQATGTADCIVYGALGESRDGPAQITLCDGKSHDARTISVSATGRAAISKGTC